METNLKLLSKQELKLLNSYLQHSYTGKLQPRSCSQLLYQWALHAMYDMHTKGAFAQCAGDTFSKLLDRIEIAQKASLTIEMYLSEPILFEYAHMLVIFLVSFIFLLPLPLSRQNLYVCLVAITPTFFGILAMYDVVCQMFNPFGEDSSDFDTTAIVETSIRMTQQSLDRRFAFEQLDIVSENCSSSNCIKSKISQPLGDHDNELRSSNNKVTNANSSRCKHHSIKQPSIPLVFDAKIVSPPLRNQVVKSNRKYIADCECKTVVIDSKDISQTHRCQENNGLLDLSQQTNACDSMNVASIVEHVINDDEKNDQEADSQYVAVGWNTPGVKADMNPSYQPL
jgi:hypothetical protein